jgi:hypothetical protein
MKGVIVDPQAPPVWGSRRRTLAEVERETHADGLAVPTGTDPMTGAVPTLESGVGWLVQISTPTRSSPRIAI